MNLYWGMHVHSLHVSFKCCVLSMYQYLWTALNFLCINVFQNILRSSMLLQEPGTCWFINV